MLNSDSPKLRVGVVGLGVMGQTHLDVYAHTPGVDVVAVADRHIELRLRGGSATVTSRDRPGSL